MQKGFATLEVILMVVVIAILASIAVPRFQAVTTSANTAKIQADLTTIDTAIAVYQMEIGSDPTMDQLVSAGYLSAEPKPPTGKCYIEGSATESPVPGSGSYTITGTGSKCHAALGTNVAGDFYLPKKDAPSASGT